MTELAEATRALVAVARDDVVEVEEVEAVPPVMPNRPE